MAHFAEIDENNIVTRVIVVGDEDIKDSDGNESEAVGIAFCKALLGDDTNWVQTSYNNNIRFRYAGKSSFYDSTNNVFCDQQPYPSWTLNTSTWVWEAPVALPDDDGFDDENPPTQYVTYDWEEASTSWTNRTVIDLT